MKTLRTFRNLTISALTFLPGTGAVAEDLVFVTRGTRVAPPDAGPAGGVILSVEDGFAYVADGESRLTVIDVRNPDRPSAIGSYTADDGIRALAISEDHAYLAAGAAGLLIIEISDRTSPSLVGMVDTVALDVEISGDWAFVTTKSSLQVTGPPQVSARLQRSTDLQSWEDWQPVEFGPTPLEIRDSEAEETRRSFYRLVVP